MNDYLKTKELYHFGIKGMKWGIRRYQNEDGTLTEEGLKKKEQYEKAINEEIRKGANVIALRKYYSSVYNPRATDYELHELDKAVNEQYIKYTKRGKKLVKKMINKGLLSDKITYDDFKKDYALQLRIGYNAFCKKVGLDPNDKKNVPVYFFAATSEKQSN